MDLDVFAFRPAQRRKYAFTMLDDKGTLTQGFYRKESPYKKPLLMPSKPTIAAVSLVNVNRFV